MRARLHSLVLVAATALVCAAPGVAQAQPAVGIVEGSNILVTLDTSAPGTFTSAIPVTGLQAGEHLAGLDYRWTPNIGAFANNPVGQPRLFGVGVTSGATDTIRPYTINAGTGVATLIPGSTSFTVTTGSLYDADFNPTVDRLRVVNNSDENFRINPNNGARADTPTNDTDINPAGNQVHAVAHDRIHINSPLAVANRTTLYGISNTNSSLVTIGGINQSPSPNGGAVMNSQALGITLAPARPADLDIGFDGVAVATLQPTGGTVQNLYTINLGTGAATLVGALPTPLGSFAIVPGSTVEFALGAQRVAEDGNALITVIRSGSVSSTSTVDFATSKGTASGSDFDSVNGKLTFAQDERMKQIEVPIAADAADEPDESFTVALSGPNALTSVGTPTTTTVTIADDDNPAPAVPESPPPPDTSAPTLTLAGAPASLKLSALLKGLKLSVTPSEPAALKAELLGTVARAQISAFNAALASATLGLGAGKRTLRLKPGRKAVAKLKRAVKLRLIVTATDAAGNSRKVVRFLRLLPAKPKRRS
jgi:hypothetical protein